MLGQFFVTKNNTKALCNTLSFLLRVSSDGYINVLNPNIISAIWNRKCSHQVNGLKELFYADIHSNHSMPNYDELKVAEPSRSYVTAPNGDRSEGIDIK